MKNDFFTLEENLKKDLQEIKSVFNTDAILKDNFDSSKIQKYFKYSSKAYDFIHSKEGALHMAVNYDGKFSQQGYQVPALEIGEIIEKNSTVLELGCGKGFNLSILAEKDKSSKFYGIDLSKTHLKYAFKKEKKLNNISFKQGSFQAIPFEDNSFDFVFGIETLCYSENIEVLIAEVSSVLKDGGKFVVYDGFRITDLKDRSAVVRESASLCGKGMAVNQFHLISHWIDTCKSNDFNITTNENLSLAVMPSLKRLYKASKKFYENRFLAKLITFLLPSYLVKNSVAGVIMPYTIMQNIFTYNKMIMTKTSNICS